MIREETLASPNREKSHVTHDRAKRYLSVRDVAKVLSVSNKTVYKLIKTGRLKSTKLGRIIRIADVSVQDMMGEKKLPPAKREATKIKRFKWMT